MLQDIPYDDFVDFGLKCAEMIAVTVVFAVLRWLMKRKNGD